jgi:serine protease AprX
MSKRLVARLATQGIICLVFLIGDLAGASASRKLSPELRAKAPDQEVDVIIQFKAGDRSGFRDLAPLRSKWHRYELELVNGSAYRVKAGDLEGLAADPQVEAVHEDHVVRAATFYGTADYGWMTALGELSPSASPALDGTGIGVAILDSGIDAAVDLQDASARSRVVYSESFVTGDKNVGDFYGHGEHVAGIVAGNGNRSTGKAYTYSIRGIAPNANLINLRVLDRNGNGRDSDVIAAISRAISLKQTYNIRVMNLSLGRPVSVACAADPLPGRGIRLEGGNRRRSCRGQQRAGQLARKCRLRHDHRSRKQSLGDHRRCDEYDGDSEPLR